MDLRLPTPLRSLGTPPADPELGWLWGSARSGAAVAPIVIVPAAVEAGFYRLNNLPERLRALFAEVDATDPDEDDLEELAPLAVGLVRSHALLDEVVEAFYTGLAALPDEVTVRRAGGDGERATSARDALLMVKRCWAEDWTSDALARRLPATGSLAPEPTDLAVHAADLRALDAAELAPDVAAAWTDAEGRVVRVSLTR